jgi:ribose 5-phosphate isomerase
VVTDNGNFIVDATFTNIGDWCKLEQALISIPGKCSVNIVEWPG